MKATGARIVARTPTFAMCFSTSYLLSKCDARVPIGGADGSKGEMHACCLRRCAGGDALSCLGVRTSERRRHREERFFANDIYSSARAFGVGGLSVIIYPNSAET
jgi:hypothetical protein